MRSQLAAFLTLHILNFCTTLTPATAIARHKRATSELIRPADVAVIPRVDLSARPISGVLDSLAQIENTSDSELGDLYVKVAPPVYVHVVPDLSTHTSILGSLHSMFASPSQIPGATATAIASPPSTFDSFMSSWTSLVGDPVISKWIVLLLGLSVALNGYLLKGIAAGSGVGLALKMPVRAIGRGVRFSKDKDEDDKKDSDLPPAITRVSVAGSSTAVSVAPATSSIPEAPVSEPERPKRVPLAQKLSLPVDLNSVDERLRAESSKPALPTPVLTPPLPSYDGPVRSLEECVDIFENGPRPVSASLALLNDEEVILLSQTGKIAAYALEKLLGNLERAVTIRRALICKLIFVPFIHAFY